jgi:hypothetical protein
MAATRRSTPEALVRFLFCSCVCEDESAVDSSFITIKGKVAIALRHEDVTFTPLPLYPSERKCPGKPLDKRLCGSQERSERSEKRGNLALTWNPTPAVPPASHYYTD